MGQMATWCTENLNRIRDLDGGFVSNAVPGCVVLCTSLHNRWANAPACVLSNLLALWPYRNFVRLALVTTGVDELALPQLLKRARVALEEGVLRVASGGNVGLNLMMSDCAVGPHYEAAQAGEAAPPVLQSWHASQHKNTAHLFGMHVAEAAPATLLGPEGSPFLLNVDADNVLSPVYLENMCNGVFGRSQNVLNATVPGNPHPPSTTGRIGMFAKLFNTLRGYDEEDTAPSGYQDVDMSTRIWRYQTLHGGELCTLKSWPVLGGALSNDATDAVTDRGLAKIANCSAETRAVWSTWSQMNDYNMKLMRKRTQAKQLTRNAEARIGGWWVEAEDWVGWIMLLHDDAMSSLGARAKAAPEVARQRHSTMTKPAARRAQEKAQPQPQQTPTAAAAAAPGAEETVEEAAPSTGATAAMPADVFMASTVVEAAPTTQEAPFVAVPPVVRVADCGTLYLWICGYQRLLEEERCPETCPVCSNLSTAKKQKVKKGNVTAA